METHFETTSLWYGIMFEKFEVCDKFEELPQMPSKFKKKHECNKIIDKNLAATDEAAAAHWTLVEQLLENTYDCVLCSCVYISDMLQMQEDFHVLGPKVTRN